ncbi:MAG: rhomboid family intramembrane serine protease [Deltaproteobacteria bacterium]|nr:rhomboid family intramembrane serine protease [Deltaproteobacteria bacterium]
MIPLRDSIPSSRPPVVNYTIIGLNVVIFLFEVSLGPHLQEFVAALGFIPARFLVHLRQGDLAASLLPLFTSMFLHGGWFHLIANMWSLYIFGDNVEDTFGHGRFLVFYLTCGLLAAFAQLVSAPSSRVPMVGASGAIAGVMGAYFSLFPWARVLTLVPVFFFVVIEIPAYVFLGLWFLFQFMSGTATIGTAQVGGVAFWAHVGGFVAGFLLVRLSLPHRFSGRRVP